MADLKEVLPEDADALVAGENDDPHGVDLWIMPYIRDSSLWPVLVVFILHIAAFLAPVLLYAVRDARIGPIVAVAVVGVLTLRGFRWEMRARNQFGAISWLIVVSWAVSAIAAFFADRHDFF